MFINEITLNCIKYKVAAFALKYNLREVKHTYFRQSVAMLRRLQSCSQYLLNVPAVGTDICKASFQPHAPSVWKDLPVDIRRTESFGRF